MPGALAWIQQHKASIAPECDAAFEVPMTDAELFIEVREQCIVQLQWRSSSSSSWLDSRAQFVSMDLGGTGRFTTEAQTIPGASEAMRIAKSSQSHDGQTREWQRERGVK